MTNKKSTKKALLFCMVSMLACFAMLIGSTFAWFSDSVTSTNNKIVAGNLDVEMEYAVFNEDGTFKEWKSVQDVSLFSEETQWEPGYTEVVYLKVKNVGSLSFNYKLDMKILEEHEGRAMDGSYFKLSNYLTFGVVKSDTETFYVDRATARAAIGEAGKLKNYSATGSIKANEAAKYLTLVVYMDEEVGNEANHMPYSKPYIDLDIRLTAYQMVDETDSFNEGYDQEAWQEEDLDLTAGEIVVSSPKQLLAVANAINASTSFENQTIILGDNIDLSSFGNWTPMGSITSPFKGTFDGANHTISGLTITKDEYSGALGLFGAVEDATIKNLTIEGNINVESEVVKADYYLMIGGIAGYGKNVTIENCTNRVQVTASSTDYTKIYIGGIVGAIDTRANFSSCVNYANLTASTTEIQSDYDMVFVGGITSSQYVQQQTIQFEECSNTGTLSGGLNGNLAYIY